MRDFLYNKKYGGQKGFTLTEILIVVVILAILASVAGPRFFAQREKAVAGEAITIMSAIRRGLLAYYDENGNYPVLNDNSSIKSTLGIDFLDPTKYGWTFKTDNAGKITATKAVGHTLTLTIAGTWSGTGNYAPNARYWPNLPT